MIGKIQRNGMPQLLAAVFFCIGLTMPAMASGEQAGSLRVSAVIDQSVYNPQGQELGDMEDLVIKRNGSVKKALITTDGFLDVGEKLVAVNYKALKITDGKMILDSTKKQLEDRPEFDYRQNDLFTNYSYRLYPYYGMMPGPYGTYSRGLPPGERRRWSDEGVRPPQSGAQGGNEPEQQNESAYPRHPGFGIQGMQNWYNHPWDRAYFPARMLASVIMGQAVVNKQGEVVATVEDLTISAGKIDQLILSYGGFLDYGDKLVAVPFRSIGFTDRGITYDITRRELESLPKIK
jgi:sporulation protein YlmC with PRC-barrel domain